MAGHSHWARIKRKKAVIDARRGKIWSKISRSIIMAARSGGGDPRENLTLRYAIDAARDANMPRDTIENAIKRGTGELGGQNYESVCYEGYGPGGAAILADALTDNRNRTASEVKRLFERYGGNLGATGCVAWLFAKKGVITVSADEVSEEKIMELALEAGVEDYKPSDALWELTCDPSVYQAARDALDAAAIKTQSAEISMIPNNTVTLDAASGRKVLELIEALEDQDDIQNVCSNFDIPDEVMATMAEEA